MLDRDLPWGGLPMAALHEVSGRAASGLAAALAGRCLGRQGALLWCQNERVARVEGELYGPGLARFGLSADRIVLVRCRDEREVLWACEEALRCRGVACAVAELGRLDLLTSRRLQLAAEAGGGVGLMLRPGEPDPAPNAALTRWRAEPVAEGTWRLILWRCKGGAPAVWMVRWDEATLSFALAQSLADRAAPAECPPPRPAAAVA